jgi:DNA invertase Pin-like site-specific DNA recombinase
MESNVEFIAADMPQANRLTIHILAAFAEHEREMISARTKAALQFVKADLAKHGSRISHSGRAYSKLGNANWQDSLSKARQAHNPTPPSPEVLDLIRHRRSAGESLRAIAKRLNLLGLKTPKGNVWYASTVSKACQEKSAIMA